MRKNVYIPASMATIVKDLQSKGIGISQLVQQALIRASGVMPCNFCQGTGWLPQPKKPTQ